MEHIALHLNDMPLSNGLAHLPKTGIGSELFGEFTPGFA